MCPTETKPSSFLLLVCTILGSAGLAGAETIDTLIRLMPAQASVSVVVSDVVRLDRTVSVWSEALAPGRPDPEVLANLQVELPWSDWIDYTKPIGFAKLGQQPGERVLMWVNVPDFAARVKLLEGSSETAGIWKLSDDKGREEYVGVLAGGYVVVASSREQLAAARVNNAAAEAEGGRGTLVGGPDLYVRVRGDALRGVASSGLNGLSELGPLLAMALSGEEMVDGRATAKALIGSAVDAARRYVEQLEYVEVYVAISSEAADVTVANGFGEGAIRDYLAGQKPAGVAAFADLPDEPYALALFLHFPGERSDVWDYISGEIGVALAAGEKARGGADVRGGPAVSGGAAPAPADTMAAVREVYAGVEGAESAIIMTQQGVRIAGSWIVRDAAETMRRIKRLLTDESAVLVRLNGGRRGEFLGDREVGGETVEEYAMEVDRESLLGGIAARIYGDKPRFWIGAAEGRVRFSVGDEERMRSVLGGGVTEPLSGSRFVREALTALPKRRNAVAILDPAGIAGLVAAAAGKVTGRPAAPGPPIAASLSLAADPARLDLHVPLRAVKRLMKEFAPVEEKSAAGPGEVEGASPIP